MSRMEGGRSCSRMGRRLKGSLRMGSNVGRVLTSGLMDRVIVGTGTMMKFLGTEGITGPTVEFMKENG